MIKAVKLSEDKEITLSNNLSWALIYKDQFGHDIVPDLMPIMSAVVRLMGELGKKDFLKNADPDAIQEALFELCSLEFVNFLNLTWSLAKANNEGIDPPDRWVRQFDEFPVDIVAPAVFELLMKGLISSKNLQSLQGLKAEK